MTIDSANLITLITTARRDLLATARTTDPHLTPEGLRARQRAEVEAIRARLLDAMPAEPAATPDRQPVLDALAPGDADTIARVQHEQAKVSALLAAGRLLPEVIATASRDRLAAILDSAETSPEVLGARDPASVLDALHEMIWDRLVQVDDAAQAVVTAEEATIPARAWRSIMEGVATTGSIPFEGRVLLNRADPAVLGLLDDGDAEAVPDPFGNLIESMMDGLDRVPMDA
ncbi:hypothetical protein [Microbacterium proteolyticum]|uniref:hypothetical protein n=1 Tax=Microbacterium proteolyticum TaxID=1572644 RepID=UPI001FAD42CB|nr:hypothetical protein [Microbacterium proteolyticum]MCI9858280.1 hypothetical protein [Microbacterium proteolyticum]